MKKKTSDTLFTNPAYDSQPTQSKKAPIYKIDFLDGDDDIAAEHLIPKPPETPKMLNGHVKGEVIEMQPLVPVEKKAGSSLPASPGMSKSTSSSESSINKPPKQPTPNKIDRAAGADASQPSEFIDFV